MSRHAFISDSVLTFDVEEIPSSFFRVLAVGGLSNAIPLVQALSTLTLSSKGGYLPDVFSRPTFL